MAPTQCSPGDSVICAINVTGRQSTRAMHKQAATLLESRQVRDALEIYEKICELDSKDTIAWFKRGEVCASIGLLNEAISHINNAIDLQPRYVEAYLALAKFHTYLNNTKKARDVLLEAVEIVPNSAEGLAMLGSMEAQLKNYRQAEVYAKRALNLDNSLPNAHATLANALLSLKKYDQALVAHENLLRLSPALPNSWHNLGIIQVHLNQLDHAEASLKSALRLSPTNMHAKLLLVKLYLQKQKTDDAEGLLQDILKVQPCPDDAWKMMIHTIEQTKKNETWVNFCKMLSRTHPDNRHVWLGLGITLEKTGAINEALESYRKAIELVPHLHEAWSRMGCMYASMERYQQAFQCFEKALSYGSDTAVTHLGYGSMLRRTGRFGSSEKHIRIATRKSPGMPSAFSELGVVLTEMGRLDSAEDAFMRVLLLDPNSKAAVAGLAEVYDRQAEHKKAYETIRPFIDGGDINSQIVCIFAKISTRLGMHEEALPLVHETLRAGGLTKQQEVDLHFRAAEIYDYLQVYDTAMSHYRLANQLKSVEYMAKQHASYINCMISLFSNDTLQKISGSNVNSEKPVFIVGMPRSGTTLVEQILATHRDIYGAGERMDLCNLLWRIGFKPDLAAPTLEQLSRVLPNVLDALTGEYLTTLESLANNEPRITDKMPGNFLWLGMIQLMFPNARVIHTTRDPLDTCLSCYFTDFNGVHDYAYDLKALGLYYCEYRKLMQHWRNTLTLPILDVSYEALVSNTEDVCRRMLEFCGLDWDPSVLDFHRSGRTAHTASYIQVRKPIYKTSIRRAGNYARYLKPLKERIALCLGSNTDIGI